MKDKSKVFYAYILLCKDKSLYAGYTTDLDNRIRVHNMKKGAKYTRARTPVKYVFYRAFSTKEKAMSFEKRIKLLARSKKLRLISGQNILD